MTTDVETTDLKLLTPYQLGPITLKNRMVMAPMTRNRAPQNIPLDIHALYYRQRSTAGLIVTEATQVSELGIGYPATPGIYNAAQVEGWKKVTKAVHEAKGRIFLQLWHVGRISHPIFHGGKPSVSSSAVAPAGKVYTLEGMKAFEEPRALELSEIPEIVEQYRVGAKNALEAGFDGVEIHGANGYLPDQFLRDGVNKRTDAYGGPVENRARFLLEVAQAAVDVWGKDRVGVRLSPSGTFNSMSDSNPEKTFGYAITKLNEMGIVYVHIVEGNAGDVKHGGRIVPTSTFRQLFKRTLIVNGGYDRARAEEVLEKAGADLISFGTTYLSNPDLPRRFKEGKPLNKPDTATFYGGGEKGYADYPFLD